MGGEGGGEGVAFFVAVALEDGAGLLEEGGLRGVGGEGGELLLEDRVDVEGEGPGGGEGLGAVGDEEVGGEVEEALRLVGGAKEGEAFGGAGPMEGGGCSSGGDGVVGMGVEPAVAAEGEDDMGAEAANALNELSGDFGEWSEFELGVLVVEHFVVVNTEDVAGGGEFGAAELAELAIGGGGAAIGAGLAVGEAKDAGFDAAAGGEGKGAAEGEALIVGMGGDAEEP